MPELARNALIAFVTSLVLVPICRSFAIQLGLVAKPKEDRWHARPTALLGGVAIAVTVLALYPVLLNPRDLPILVGGVAVMCGVGLVDDLLSLKPYTKLVAEVAIASYFVFFGYRLDWSSSLTVDTVLTMLWIVGLTNALNLLDNMDGLCAGIALVAGTSVLAAMLLTSGVGPTNLYLTLVLGATAGFLVYNFHPASIFMGDCGSLFLGVNLAVLTLNAPGESHASSNVLAILVGPLLVLLVPILDTSLVTTARLLSGRSPAQGGRDHSSHRLVAIGLSERAAVVVLWSLAALGGLLSIAVRRIDSSWSSIGVALFLIAMIIFAVYLAHVRVYDETDVDIRTGRVTPVVLHFVYRRRVAEVILDFCLAALAYYAAYRLRFEGPDFTDYFPTLLRSLPLVVGIQSIALYLVGGYRGVWRYFNLMDGVVFAKGVLLGTATTVCLLVLTYRFENYSRGVFVIYASLMLLALIGSRASFRLISEFASRRRPGGSRLVIYGAGAGGAAAVRELLSAEAGRYRMLGFIDDDPAKTRARMQGYPVLGDVQSLEGLIQDGGVDTVILSTHLIDVERLDRLKELCSEHRVTLARLHYKLDELVAVS
jgi:UDP-GlcNAc:undecaprenyl-phosphate/decaprenyl-phosphate GlcNAc-1-phosphate transferase